MASLRGALLALSLLLLWVLSGQAVGRTLNPIKAIYSFGDSIADTGNLIREGGKGGFGDTAAHLPYGETIKKPTGRCSDGYLMIDYLAMDLGLPLLNPYLDKHADFSKGVNFAVAGATALGSSFFNENGLVLPYTNSSLDVQLGWFKDHLKSICSSKSACTERLESSLFMVGEIGGNDYNFALFEGKTMDEVIGFVPQVVMSIENAIREVINAGAVNIIVPGNFPIGCMPGYLTAFQTTDRNAYDEHKCLIRLNGLALVHNKGLQLALERLRKENPHVQIKYAGYFGAFKKMLHDSKSLGFVQSSLLEACCGSGGTYNFNATNMCGAPGVSSCNNPRRHISWDGIHLTQAAYRIMSKELVYGGFTY